MESYALFCYTFYLSLTERNFANKHISLKIVNGTVLLLSLSIDLLECRSLIGYATLLSIYSVLYNDPSYSRILIGSHLWIQWLHWTYILSSQARDMCDPYVPYVSSTWPTSIRTNSLVVIVVASLNTNISVVDFVFFSVSASVAHSSNSQHLPSANVVKSIQTNKIL